VPSSAVKNNAPSTAVKPDVRLPGVSKASHSGDLTDEAPAIRTRWAIESANPSPARVTRTELGIVSTLPVVAASVVETPAPTIVSATTAAAGLALDPRARRRSAFS
jgi:hypothetical protein